MDKPTDKLKIGIIVPTMDRPDFVTRQLNYYANLKSPHAIYIADSSNEENAQIIKKEVNRLGNKLDINYQPSPVGDSIKSILQLLESVKEKYVSFIGDDDYQVPDTLSACAEFLEDNPDYETAIGKSVTIRVEGNAVYGKLEQVHDYPRYSIESDTASQRLFEYLGPKLTSITSAVLPAQHMLKYFRDAYPIKDVSIKGEELPCCFMIVAGKSKVLDRIGLVRQIHKNHFHLDDMFDRLTNPDWNASYHKFRHLLVSAISVQDKISTEEAERSFKKAFWKHLNILLPRFYKEYNPTETRPRISFRTKLAASFPTLKQVYKTSLRPLFTDKRQLHYEVTQPSSKYYKDFQPIVKSLSRNHIDTF